MGKQFFLSVCLGGYLLCPSDVGLVLKLPDCDTDNVRISDIAGIKLFFRYKTKEDFYALRLNSKSFLVKSVTILRGFGKVGGGVNKK